MVPLKLFSGLRIGHFSYGQTCEEFQAPSFQFAKASLTLRGFAAIVFQSFPAIVSQILLKGGFRGLF